MEYKRLSDIDIKQKVNNRVFTQFLARDISVRLQKDNKTKYVSFNMVDKDVVEEVKMFGVNDSTLEMLKEGTVYNAAVDVQPYNKAPSGYSCIIYNIEPSGEPSESFLDWATDLDGSRGEIERLLPELVNSTYGIIAYNILRDNWDRFSAWTAAKSMHHTKLGELMVHTAEVMGLCNIIANYFNSVYDECFINKPLLLSAAMIHDIGKVNELDVNMLSGQTDYSSNSVLCSHIMGVMAAVDIEAFKLGIGQQQVVENEVGEEEGTKSEEDLADEVEAIALLKHCLAAHHGKLEYGSPITPNTPEAEILHIADMLSAGMYKFDKLFNGVEPGTSSSEWAAGGYKSAYKDSTK